MPSRGEPGGPALGRGQRRVAEASHAALRGHEAGAVAHEVGEDVALGILDHGAVRHAQRQGLAGGAIAEVAHPGTAVATMAVRCVVVGEQRGGLGVHDQGDVTAVPAVATVGTTQGLELLPLHGGHAVPSMPAGNVQDHPVHESRHGRLSSELLGTTRAVVTSLAQIAVFRRWSTVRVNHCGGGGPQWPTPAGALNYWGITPPVPSAE